MEAGLARQLREHAPRRGSATARNSRSEEMFITAWATQRVATSTSVRLLRTFICLAGRRSSAVQNTAVSSRSRLASVVALLGSKVR
jgi:hypothetical protein